MFIRQLQLAYQLFKFLKVNPADLTDVHVRQIPLR